MCIARRASACRSMRPAACSTPTRSGRSTRSIGIVPSCSARSGCTTTRSSFRSMRWRAGTGCTVRADSSSTSPRFRCAGAFETLRKLLELTAEFAEGSFLVVLKLFGDKPSPGVLSFPLPGATLALDFPNKGESTRRLLDRMADVVLAAGGRLYPAKDATMSGAAFRAGYPAWRTVEAQRDPAHHVRLLAPRDRGGRMSKILILGATSAIAQAYARRRAAQGASFILAGRHRGAARRERGRSRSPAVPRPRRSSRRISPRSRRIDESLRAITARFGAPDEVVSRLWRARRADGGRAGSRAGARADGHATTPARRCGSWGWSATSRPQARSPSWASARSRATAAAPSNYIYGSARPRSTASSRA